MTYDELMEVARTEPRPHTIWIDDGSVPEIAKGFQALTRENSNVQAIERGIRSGTMSLYGVPVRVHEVSE